MTHKEYMQATAGGTIPPQPTEEAHGAKDDSGKPRYELLPADAVEQIVLVLTKGAEKYAPRNWEKGIDYGRVYGAIERHLTKFWKGNNIDPEWGLHHLAHAGCGVLFLLSYELRKMKQFDDRPLIVTAAADEPTAAAPHDEPAL